MSRRPRPLAAWLLTVLAVGSVAGCASGTGGGRASGSEGNESQPTARCGTAHTAVGVPIEIDVEHGKVPCQVAMSVVKGYTRAVAAGKVPGNGGGAPVKIHGWTCQGFNTPVELATGNTSACRKDSDEIMAVLPSPPEATASPGSP